MIGNLRIGSFEYVELEAIMCKKPVISFNDKKIKISVDDKEIESPFIPDSNDPKDIARVIDEFVVSEQFRQNIFKKNMILSKIFQIQKKQVNGGIHYLKK